MRKLFSLISLLFTLAVSAQVNFTFTPIPLNTDFIRPGAGATLWNDQNGPFGTINIPVSGSPLESKDMYIRLSMTDFFSNSGAADSTIIFNRLDAHFQYAITHKQGLRFGVMSVCNNCDVGNNTLISYAGGQSAIPQFLHNLMQGESVHDWLCTAGDQAAWIPNWNSLQFRRWVGKLSQAIRNHIDVTSFSGVAFKDVLKIYDLRYYGAYGEQHSADITPGGISGYPTGTFGTAASLNALVDVQATAFHGYKMVIPFNAFDCEWLPHTMNPIAYGQHILDHPDSIGWINDHLGSNEGYDHSYLEDNNRMGGSYNSKLMNRWKYTPLGGEPVGWGSPPDRSAIPLYVQNYHLSFFGNGNLNAITNANVTEANNVRTASRLAGYRIRLTGGSANVGASFTINLNWINEGLAPPYERWKVQYLLKNGGTVVSTLTSAFNLQYFQPSGTPITKTDVFGIPAIPTGTYGLYVIVRDTTGFLQAMPLAVTPEQTDHSYFLGNVTIGGGVNQNPVANAGPNQSITGTSTTLTSTGSSDADGTIASFAWSRVSGPNVPTIVTPTGATTSVTGMIPGVYVFNLTVTDDDGGTGSDQIQVTVNGNQPPVAQAGANQVIALPTAAVTVNGNASTDDVAISSYLWSQVNGPNTANIVSPTSFTSTINGLIQGTYTFRLRVTDASGLFSTDDMNVTVTSGNNPPIANAGANITVTMPIVNFSTILLDGSLSSDPGGAVSTYLWSQVGGPASTTITAPTNVATYINAVTVAGIYIFRLTVTDNQGLTATDDIQVTVNPAANNAPVASAGPDQTIQLPTTSVLLTSAASTDDIGIFSRTWSKVSGPAPFTITTPTTVTTTVTGLVAGVYVFRVTVFDAGGLSSFEDVTITVLPLANTAPIAVAGNNISITAPTSTTSFDGSGSTDDVGIVTYLWTKVSGPGGGTISTPNAVTTNITSLAVGTYVYRLRVTDVAGLFDTDDITVVVNAAANNAPIADAGANQTITLPTNTVALSGAGSTDDVGITGYLWTQISGPGVATISSALTSSTNMNNLVAGIYFFQLQVFDAGGLTDVDEVMITVNPAIVVPPVSGGHRLIRSLKFLPRTY